MALAPYPVTTIDGHTVYADAARSALPRHAFLAVNFYEYHGEKIGVAEFGGDTLEAVARRCKGRPELRIVEVAKHEWRSLPHRKSVWAS